MPIKLSEITFPDYVTGIRDKNEGWLKGGYDFQTQAPTFTRFFVVNQLIKINLADLNYSMPETGHLISDPYTIFTFMNGYTIKVVFEEIFRSPNVAFVLTTNWYDKSGNPIGNDPEAQTGFHGYSSLNKGYDTNWGNINGGDCVCYFWLNTRYYPQTNPPAGTPCVNLDIIQAAGFESYGFSINPGNVSNAQLEGSIQGASEICYWSDLEKFETFLHSTGDSFSGDQFTEDPFPDEPGGENDPSGPGGGGGNYDPTSDPVDFPDLPIGGALTSGMIKGFVMNAGNLQTLQNKLWDMSLFDIATQFQKLLNQPLDCLISLHCLPVLPASGNSEEIKLGSFPTGVSASRITNQYMEIDAGSITLSEFWGSALDYAPYTQVEIYVPFVGFRNLQIEDIQKTTLNLKYHVDVLTGDCVAYLKCGASVLYSWTGNCLAHIPCSSSSSDLLAKNIAAVGSIGMGIATGNAASVAGGALTGAVNTATAKNHVQRSGEVAGSPGLMSEFTPYLIFHRPRQSLAKDYNKFKGYPSNITYTLGNLSGYTEVDHIHLTGIKATDTELEEIETLLKEGVII